MAMSWVINLHRGALALRAGAAVLAVLLLVLIDLGLRPVGGLLGPGGWYLPLALAAVLLTLLRSSDLRGQGSSGHDSR
jgi:hypothetical protein